jgi:hypothetical protein
VFQEPFYTLQQSKSRFPTVQKKVGGMINSGNKIWFSRLITNSNDREYG